eukprot:15111709-Heterocapsa_arctica.AAC.1
MPSEGSQHSHTFLLRADVPAPHLFALAAAQSAQPHAAQPAAAGIPGGERPAWQLVSVGRASKI